MKKRFILTLLSCILFTQFTQSMEFGFSFEEKDESENQQDLISLDTSEISHSLNQISDSFLNIIYDIKDSIFNKLNKKLVFFKLYEIKRLNENLKKAVENNNIKEVKQILEYGANINAKDEFGETPLHWAANNGNYETAKFLIQYGANVNAKNKYGMTAISTSQYRCRNGNFGQIAELIRNKKEELKNNYQEYLKNKLILLLNILMLKLEVESKTSLPIEILCKISGFLKAEEIEKILNINFDQWYKNMKKDKN